MFLKLFSFLMVFTAFINVRAASQAEAASLEGQDIPPPKSLVSKRTERVQGFIDSRFEAISRDSCSRWKQSNGKRCYPDNPASRETDEHLYRPCGFSEEEIFVSMIQGGVKEGRTLFSAIDVGAGHYGWVRQMTKWNGALAEFLKSEEAAAYSPLKIFVVGVCGERSPLNTYHCEKYGNHTVVSLYLGSVKIENFQESLVQKMTQESPHKHFFDGVQIPLKFDLALSVMTLCHLKDPLGTLTDIYQLLRTGSIMAYDFFTYDIMMDKAPDMMDKAPYMVVLDQWECFKRTWAATTHLSTKVMCRDNVWGGRRIGQFLICKDKNIAPDNPLVRLKYEGVVETGDDRNFSSTYIVFSTPDGARLDVKSPEMTLDHTNFKGGVLAGQVDFVREMRKRYNSPHLNDPSTDITWP
ncbi:MAG: hypothetical protein H6925_03800 [Holosporaceae bacterium]|nr:MAG: hypothetical protein H6925_03800 [Holosporaceae bacterium]